MPPAPTYFHKPVSALNAHGGEVVRPPRCRYLNYEGEIAIVIGRECRHIAPDEAAEYIAGYTVANDYGLHDFRDTDAGSMLRVKGSDTLCPLGPGARRRLGLPREADPDARERRGAPGRLDRRDDVGHALPGRRHRADDHARARRRDPVGDAGELPPGRARRRRRGRGRGTRHAAEHDRRGRRSRSARTSARSRARPKRSISTAFGGDWEFRGIRPPQGADVRSGRAARPDAPVRGEDSATARSGTTSPPSAAAPLADEPDLRRATRPGSGPGGTIAGRSRPLTVSRRRASRASRATRADPCSRPDQRDEVVDVQVRERPVAAAAAASGAMP